MALQWMFYWYWNMLSFHIFFYMADFLMFTKALESLKSFIVKVKFLFAITFHYWLTWKLLRCFLSSIDNHLSCIDKHLNDTNYLVGERLPQRLCHSGSKRLSTLQQWDLRQWIYYVETHYASKFLSFMLFTVLLCNGCIICSPLMILIIYLQNIRIYTKMI